MARKARQGEPADEPRKRGRQVETEDGEREDAQELRPAADDSDFDLSSLPAVSDLRPNLEPDPREVDNLTERIFSSVLSRYGWERHGDRVEHVGHEVHHRH